MNKVIRYHEEYGYNLDCESCCNLEGTCIGCEAEEMDTQGEASVELEYEGIVADINSAEGSLYSCIELILACIEDSAEEGQTEAVFLDLDGLCVSCSSGDEYYILYKGEDILGLPYKEFVLRLNNVYRGLVNMGTEVPFLYDYVLPLDGGVSMVLEDGAFTFSYLHGRGELTKDISPSYLKEYYKYFLWLDRYHMDIEYHLYGHKSNFEECASRWYDLGYMLTLK